MARDIQSTQLDNGVTVITDRVTTVESVAIGIWADVGARHEQANVNGIAHMVEHMLFKGTQNRSAQQIVDEIENVGGHMNAYTSREITSYHVHLLKKDAPLAFDVLSDMYLNSTMPDDELKKERHVILQEIGMCNDTPDDLIFDHFYAGAYKDQAMGRAILGESDIVASMPRQALFDHVNGFYTPENTVICAAGNIDHDQLVRMAGDKFGDMRANAKSGFDAASYTGGEVRDNKAELEQAHVMLGFDSVSRLDDDFYAVRALSSILGGGMSSRLFQEVREKRGLVYSVFAYAQGTQDSGLFGIYAGTGAKDTAELMPVLCEEIQKIQHDVKEEELARVKSQLMASLLMGQESMMSRADMVAKTMIHRRKEFNPQDLIDQVESLTVQRIQKAAQKIFASKPTLAAIGPLDHLISYDQLVENL